MKKKWKRQVVFYDDIYRYDDETKNHDNSQFDIINVILISS